MHREERRKILLKKRKKKIIKYTNVKEKRKLSSTLMSKYWKAK
jgi:hypothetical protein